MEQQKLSSNKALEMAQQALSIAETSSKITAEKFESERRLNVERAIYVKESLARLEEANRDIRNTLDALVKNIWMVGGTVILMLLSIIGWFISRLFHAI